MISTLLTVVFGGTSIVSTFLFYGANKRAKNVEVKDAELGYYNKRIDALHEDIDVLNNQLTNAYKDKERCEGIIADKTAKIRGLNDDKVTLYKKLNKKDNYIASLKRYIEWLELWKCEREMTRPDMSMEELECSCNRRKPPHQTPVRYVAYDKNTISSKDDDKS